MNKSAKNKIGFYTIRKCITRKKTPRSKFGIKIGFLRIFQSSRSQPAFGVKQTPKARVSLNFNFFFFSYFCLRGIDVKGDRCQKELLGSGFFFFLPKFATNSKICISVRQIGSAGKY